MTPALATERLCKSFGGLAVTRELSLTLERGARHALIGPNGAGKTTLVNQLAGVLAPSSGTIRLEGEDITRLPAHQRVVRGLARTFQINNLFPNLLALEAVANAVIERRRRQLNVVQRRLLPLTRRREELDEAAQILTGLGLARLMMRPTRELAYGQQRLLELALALAARPRVLLLDEPAAGVPEGESDGLFEALERLPAELAILLIEHDMSLVFRFARRITVLVGGAELVSGSPREIAADERVREVYLGRRHG